MQMPTCPYNKGHGYAYDDYGPCKALTPDYIAGLTHKFSLAHFYPATPSSQETGARRGSIVLWWKSFREWQVSAGRQPRAF